MTVPTALLAASVPTPATVPRSGPGAWLQIFVVVAILGIAATAFLLVYAYRDKGEE